MAIGRPYEVILVSSGTLATVIGDAIYEAPEAAGREIAGAFERYGAGLKVTYRLGIVPPWKTAQVHPPFLVHTGNVIPGAVHRSWGQSHASPPGELWAVPKRINLDTELVVLENHVPKWETCASIITALAFDGTSTNEWLWRMTFLWLYRLVTTRTDMLLLTLSKQMSSEIPGDEWTEADLRNLCLAAARSSTARCVLQELTGRRWVAEADSDAGTVRLRPEGGAIERG